MIALDTNVLVRHLTQDDREQAAIASREIEGAGDHGEGVFISDIVLCELVWVLEDCYDQRRNQIVEVLNRILQTASFCFQAKDLLWSALADYREGKGDFSDYLIGRTAKASGAGPTLTFDKALKGSDLFRVL